MWETTVKKKMAAEVTIVFATLPSRGMEIGRFIFSLKDKKATDKIHKMITQILQILVQQKPYLLLSVLLQSAQGPATPYLQDPSKGLWDYG